MLSLSGVSVVLPTCFPSHSYIDLESNRQISRTLFHDFWFSHLFNITSNNNLLSLEIPWWQFAAKRLALVVPPNAGSTVIIQHDGLQHLLSLVGPWQCKTKDMKHQYPTYIMGSTITIIVSIHRICTECSVTWWLMALWSWSSQASVSIMDHHSCAQIVALVRPNQSVHCTTFQQIFSSQVCSGDRQSFLLFSKKNS